MKKIVLVLLVFSVLSASAGFAGDLSFAFEDARFHSDYLFGFAPLYLRAGVDYTGLQIMEGQRTDLVIIAGGALVSASPWTDADGHPIETSTGNTGSVFDDDNSYSRWQGDLSFKLMQGLVADPARENAVFAVYGKYGFHTVSPQENAAGTTSIILNGTDTAYPDKSGVITNSLQAGIVYDVLDRGDVYNGLLIDASVLYAPSWLGNSIVGRSDFCNINLTAKGYLTLLDLKKDDGLALVGIYLADRLMADYVFGSAVPQFYQEDPSLGNKMRGFESLTMGTAFTVVNNLDLRIYGIELIDDINPIVNLFFDAGYFAGNYYNTSFAGSGFVCSAGFELAANIVDFAQLGYSFAFPLYGKNMTESPFTASLMLMYKF